MRKSMLIAISLATGMTLGLGCGTDDLDGAPGGESDARVGATDDAGLQADSQIDPAPDSAVAPVADGAIENDSSASPDASVDPVSQLVFSATMTSCDASCSETAFDIGTLRELYLYTLWSGVSGEHVELRKFYSPDGSLYYQRLVAFDTEATDPRPFTSSDSLPHTRMIQPTESTAAGQIVVWDYLLVGGTWITQHHMVGEWRVEILLDKMAGEPDLVQTFTLTD